MDNIVAAEFGDFVSAEGAMQALEGDGFASSQITSFYLNAPGQHATYPIGGDQDEDPEAKGAGPGPRKARCSAASRVAGAASRPCRASAPLEVAGGPAAGAEGSLGELSERERVTRGRSRRSPGRPAGATQSGAPGARSSGCCRNGHALRCKASPGSRPAACRSPWLRPPKSAH